MSPQIQNTTAAASSRNALLSDTGSNTASAAISSSVDSYLGDTGLAYAKTLTTPAKPKLSFWDIPLESTKENAIGAAALFGCIGAAGAIFGPLEWGAAAGLFVVGVAGVSAVTFAGSTAVSAGLEYTHPEFFA